LFVRSYASSALIEYAKLATGNASGYSDAQKKAADVNSDGNVDAKDASIMLSYYSYVSTGGNKDLKHFINDKLQ
jgi:hypothetical protein